MLKRHVQADPRGPADSSRAAHYPYHESLFSGAFDSQLASNVPLSNYSTIAHPTASDPNSAPFVSPFAHLAIDDESARLLSGNLPLLPEAMDPAANIMQGLHLAADAAVAKAFVGPEDAAATMAIRREVRL